VFLTLVPDFTSAKERKLQILSNFHDSLTSINQTAATNVLCYIQYKFEMIENCFYFRYMIVWECFTDPVFLKISSWREEPFACCCFSNVDKLWHSIILQINSLHITYCKDVCLAMSREQWHMEFLFMDYSWLVVIEDLLLMRHFIAFLIPSKPIDDTRDDECIMVFLQIFSWMDTSLRIYAPLNVTRDDAQTLWISTSIMLPKRVSCNPIVLKNGLCTLI